MNLASARRHEDLATPHDRTTTTTRRLGMAAPARLGVIRARVVAEGHRCRPRRKPRGGLPVAQTPPRGRCGRPAHPAAAWTDGALDGGAARRGAGAVGARRRGVWVPRRRVDGPPRRRGQSGAPLASASTAIMSAACCARRVGVTSSPAHGPRSATRRPFSSGRPSAGRPSKKSGRRRLHRRLGRRSRFLPPADGGAHVGATGADADPARHTDP